MEDFEGRVAIAALRYGMVIKKLSLSFIAKQVHSLCPDGVVEVSEAELYKYLQQIQIKYPDQFGEEAPAVRESASQRLERANAQAPAREQRSSSPGVIDLSDKQRKWLEKLSPDQRLDYANGIVAP